MDRDGIWGSMMSCLESVKEYALELHEVGDIDDDECFWYEKEIENIEANLRALNHRWEEEEARLVKVNTLSIDLRFESLDLLRLLCNNVGVEHGTREEMIARLLE